MMVCVGYPSNIMENKIEQHEWRWFFLYMDEFDQVLRVLLKTYTAQDRIGKIYRGGSLNICVVTWLYMVWHGQM